MPFSKLLLVTLKSLHDTEHLSEYIFFCFGILNTSFLMAVLQIALICDDLIPF